MRSKGARHTEIEPSTAAAGKQPPSRVLLSTADAAFDSPAFGLDLDELRRLFLKLCDDTAQAVQSAGHDLDEVIVERFLRCRLCDSSTFDAPADVLSDKERLLHSLSETARRNQGLSMDAGSLHVVGLRVVAYLERWT